MTTTKRWLICAFLFIICFIILQFLNFKKPIVEGHGGGSGGHGGGSGGGSGGGGGDGGGHGGYSFGRVGYGKNWGGYYGNYGGGAVNVNPLYYIYDDDDYYPYWYRSYAPMFF
jgi:hypothetical protein